MVMEAEVTLSCGGVVLATWHVPLTGRPALEVVDELASVRLAAKRRGCEVRVSAPCGLGAVLDAAGLLGSIEVIGQPEGLEQRRVPEVQEVVVPDDPVP
jgi:hypothetical protein